MVSKEEIVHSLLKEIKEGFRDIEFIGNNLYPLDPNQFRVLSEYIYQLETDKQKLIEKLEEKLEITKKQYSENTLLNIRVDGKMDILEEILSFLKGEKNE